MPSIGVAPASGTPGSTVTLTGSGFAANSPLSLTFSLASLGWSWAVEIAEASDGSGNVRFSFQVPQVPAILPSSDSGGVEYTVTLADGSLGSAQATFTVCSKKDGDGIDSSAFPFLAAAPDGQAGGTSQAVAYIHHDGAHWIAWPDPSAGTGEPGTFGNPVGIVFPPPDNHSINVTRISDDGASVINYELDTKYRYVFGSHNSPGFICQCVAAPLEIADPIWSNTFYFASWSKPIYDLRFGSDGTNLWLAAVTRETVAYPYISADDEVGCDTPLHKCSMPNSLSQFEPLSALESSYQTEHDPGYTRRYHPAVGIPDDWFYQVTIPPTDSGEAGSGHWSPPVAVVFQGGTGGFTRIGEIDAQFCFGDTNGMNNVDGGALLGGPGGSQKAYRGGFFSGVSVAASEAEPGVCHVVWSEGGDNRNPNHGVPSPGAPPPPPPPAPTVGPNILSEGNFPPGQTSWSLTPRFPWGESPLVTGQLDGWRVPPDSFSTIDVGSVRLACGKLDSTWDSRIDPFTGQDGGPGTQTQYPTFEWGVYYLGQEWSVPTGQSQWVITFTYKRDTFSLFELSHDVTNFPPYGIGAGTPHFPQAGDGGAPLLAAGWTRLGAGIGFGPAASDGTRLSAWNKISVPIDGYPSWDSQNMLLDGGPYTGSMFFNINNAGPPSNFTFVLSGAQEMYDPYDYIGETGGVVDTYNQWGYAGIISDVQLREVSGYVSPDLGGTSGVTGESLGEGGWDGGPPNRDYRVAYATFDAGAKTAEYDLFSSHVDRSDWSFEYGGQPTGYLWPEQEDCKFSGAHALRNEHGSPVLFIAWPRSVKNEIHDGGFGDPAYGPVPPDDVGNPWLDNSLAYSLPAVEMYDIAGGTPTLLQTLGGDLVPTEDEVGHYYSIQEPNGLPVPTTLTLDAIAANPLGIGQQDGRGITTAISRGIAVSFRYEDPLDGGTPVYLVSVPWTQWESEFNLRMRGFYRVPCDGSAPFDFMDGKRQLDFTVVKEELGSGLYWGPGDFYSDSDNVWCPLSDLTWDRICANRWQQPYLSGDTSGWPGFPGAWNHFYFLDEPSGANATGFKDLQVPSMAYLPDEDALAYAAFSFSDVGEGLSVARLKICRGCDKCSCAPTGMHTWHVVG